jgi:5-methylcytosine-specific restriction endonuclease McrA
VTGCRGCLGRLVLLVLLAWPIGEFAQILGWSDATTGGLFLVVLALLAIGGSPRGRTYNAARPTSQPLVPSIVPGRRPASASQRWDGSRGPRPPRRGHTSARDGTRRARDPLPAQLRFGILQRDGFRCRYCGRPGSAPGVVLHVDHLVPLAAGGATSEGNLLTACEECNLGKGTRVVVAGGS